MAVQPEDHVHAQKKTRPTERALTTGLFYLRALQLGLTNADLERMTVGMVTDLIIEAGNDKEPYCELATQEDFDRF